MDAVRLLLHIAMAINACKCEAPPSLELDCFEYDTEPFNLLEGEAFVYKLWDIDGEPNNTEIRWEKNGTRPEPISSEETQPVYYHGKSLFFLKVQPEDAGLYIAEHSEGDGNCSHYFLKISVFKSETDKALLYGKIKSSSKRIYISCPERVTFTCEDFKGKLSWKKDFRTLNVSDNKNQLLIENASKEHDGVYTCVCTWEHKDRKYQTSGSRRLITEHDKPYILEPQSNEVLVDKGLEKTLRCSVFCGTNIMCNASWKVNGRLLQPGGHSQSDGVARPNDSTATAVMTIDNVSDEYFQVTFTCSGISTSFPVSKNITLRQREISHSATIQKVGLWLACLLFLLLLKFFTIDIALLFRPCVTLINHKKDTRMYDAYVIYQMECLDKATENILVQFVTNILPSVLEEKCGYRLYIQGRDDMPGQDHMELVESCIQQSRRLMVILTPCSGSECPDQHPDQHSHMGGFASQIVLHHALIQSEMGVILIQIGDTGPGGFTHLPPGLQYLILKSAPLRWRQGSWGAAVMNSRFWKKVRYLMPMVPAATKR